ncbi:hypothetical protein FNW52_06280 [Flavobacterium sp. ZT3R18]|uniref:hypothetical protein n=1 Tax=Flavobacterium sp. ZT3R18 TaxID=2594429 RepID=UPI00117AF875|nr:hypothetical protein [Flavobacterium sp. ZT3R18]TRX36844.1 hypothetical protein FNW52_06280 [Flavobacterium sp. ZT3R18]
MITKRVLDALEIHEGIASILKQRTAKSDWKTFTRTVFNLIAKYINQNVTRTVVENPYLLQEHLLFGEQKFEMLLSELKLDNSDDLVEYLKALEPNKPFNWVSGKTLQSYWSGGSPKELKLNVLLTFLAVPIQEWDEWKYGAATIIPNENSSKPNDLTEGYFNFSKTKTVKDHFLKCISKYYLGSYFLYYLKSDKHGKVVKAPFIIYEDEEGEILFRTINEGQRYISYPAQKMANALCFMGKNLDWEEINEMHLINIGMETNPEVLFGVSITMSKYGGFPMALKNILIRQSHDIHFLDEVKEKEFYIDHTAENEQDALVLNYFKKQESQIMFAEFGCSLADFKETLNNL